MPITTGKTQVKPTSRGVRIWIEGFEAGQNLAVEYYANKIIIK